MPSKTSTVNIGLLHCQDASISTATCPDLRKRCFGQDADDSQKEYLHMIFISRSSPGLSYLSAGPDSVISGNAMLANPHFLLRLENQEVVGKGMKQSTL